MAAPNVHSNTDKQDKDYWATPSEIYRGALAYFHRKGLLPTEAEYCFDVCANKHNTKHPKFFSEQDDALLQNWSFVASVTKHIGNGKGGIDDITQIASPTNLVAWCNPPYSRGSKEQFIAKAITEAESGLFTIMLLPNDTSAKWFSTCVKNAIAISFICDGRIGFINNATGERVNGNNAGSILVLFGKEKGSVARTLYVTKQRLESFGREVE